MRNSIKTRKKTKANFYKLRKELRSNHHHTTYKTKKTNNKYVNTPPSTEQIFYSALSHPRQSVGFITVHPDGVLDFLCGFDSTENDPVLLFFFLLLLFSFFRLPLSKLFFQQNPKDIISTSRNCPCSHSFFCLPRRLWSCAMLALLEQVRIVKCATVLLKKKARPLLMATSSPVFWTTLQLLTFLRARKKQKLHTWPSPPCLLI